MVAHNAIAVIGAGIAGLACAQRLLHAGHSVTLFDKARGPGGRMSSKQRPEATLDLGAQAFTVRHDAFAAEVERWREAGCVAEWPHSLYQAGPSGWQAHHDGQQRFIGAPRMSAITRHMAEAFTAQGGTLHTATRITALGNTDAGWQLESEHDSEYKSEHDSENESEHNGTFGPYARVIVTAPPPQAEGLLQPWDTALSSLCQRLPQQGCWAGWAVFDAPLPALPGVDPGWQMARVTHPALRLVTRNNTKPGRGTQPESVSLLAQIEWSDTHLEQQSEWATQQLLDALASLFPSPTVLPALIDSGAHRWRYSQPAEEADMPAEGFAIGHAGLSLCGDSLRGGRVEDAWLSGYQLAQALLDGHRSTL